MKAELFMLPRLLLWAARHLGALANRREMSWSLARLSRTWRRRRELFELLRADEKVLLELGLTRRDVMHLLSRPFWRDPLPSLLRTRAPGKKMP